MHRKIQINSHPHTHQHNPPVQSLLRHASVEELPACCEEGADHSYTEAVVEGVERVAVVEEGVGDIGNGDFVPGRERKACVREGKIGR